jgi:hypothetical protein
MFQSTFSRLVLSLAILGVALAFAPGKIEAANIAKAEGKITAINLSASTVTFATLSGKTLTVTATSKTLVERNNQHVALSALKVGDTGDVVFNTQSMSAYKIDVKGP